MSRNSLSSLAVLDIADDEAAIHNGGVTFTGISNVGPGPTGNSPGIFFDNGPGNPIGLLRNFSFTGALSGVNNTLDAFQVTGIAPGRSYRVQFFDNTGFGGFLGQFDFSAGSPSFRTLAAGLQNRTSSVSLFRLT